MNGLDIAPAFRFAHAGYRLVTNVLTRPDLTMARSYPGFRFAHPGYGPAELRTTTQRQSSKMIGHTGRRQLGKSFVSGANQALEIGIGGHTETCPRCRPDLVPANAIEPAILVGTNSKRSPDERSEIRGSALHRYPAFRSAHAGYGLIRNGRHTRLRPTGYAMMQPAAAGDNGGHHMRRIVLAASTILALTVSAAAQSEEGTIEQIARPGGRIIFVFKPATNTMQCPSIDTRAITPQVAPRLGRTIFAEALVYGRNAVGYVFLISYGAGFHEVYFASYTQRACVLDESQSRGRAFVGDDRFNEAKAYYHSLLNELSE
jgi:hypothetical protein